MDILSSDVEIVFALFLALSFPALLAYLWWLRYRARVRKESELMRKGNEIYKKWRHPKTSPSPLD
jgi:membrane protein implicated in regulation of membrane protease activity